VNGVVRCSLHPRDDEGGDGYNDEEDVEDEVPYL
jgi:hypothetical protein